MAYAIGYNIGTQDPGWTIHSAVVLTAAIVKRYGLTPKELVDMAMELRAISDSPNGVLRVIDEITEKDCDDALAAMRKAYEQIKAKEVENYVK